MGYFKYIPNIKYLYLYASCVLLITKNYYERLDYEYISWSVKVYFKIMFEKKGSPIHQSNTR